MKKLTLTLISFAILLSLGTLSAQAKNKPKPKPKPVSVKVEASLARKNASLLLGALANGDIPTLCKSFAPALRVRYPLSECKPLTQAKAQRFSDEQANDNLGRASAAARGAAKENGDAYPVSSLDSSIQIAEPDLSATFVTSPNDMLNKQESVVGIDTSLSNTEHVFLYIHSHSGKVLKIIGDLTGEAVSETGVASDVASLPSQTPSVKITLFSLTSKRSFSARATISYAIGGQEEVYLQVHALTPYLKSAWQVTQIDTKMLVAKTG